MSFASELKMELCESAWSVREEGARWAQSYGLLLFSRSFSSSQVVFTSELEPVAELAAAAMAELSGRMTPIDRRGRAGGHAIYHVEMPSEACPDLLAAFGYPPGEINLRLRSENIGGDPGDAWAFLRGAFLACGMMADPQKRYHFEYRVPYKRLSEDLGEELLRMGIRMGSVTRKGAYLLYLKDSEPIEEMLTAMGAIRAAFQLMDAKIYKDIRNKANRVRNCETANIDKTVAASLSQIEDIEWILEKKGLDSLPDELKEIAKLRLDNPEMSLRELGMVLSPPLSRSGVNHRLRRLSDLAQTLRGESD